MKLWLKLQRSGNELHRNRLLGQNIILPVAHYKYSREIDHVLYLKKKVFSKWVSDNLDKKFIVFYS